MEALRYLDFDLQLVRDGDHYVAQVLQSPAGEANCSFTLPFTQDRLENLMMKMSPARGLTRGYGSDDLTAARELGGKLFESVFSGEVLGRLRISLDEASRQDGVGLRLKLRLQDAPELADLPWEFLFDSSLDRFIAQSDFTPIVRYIELPQRIRPLTAVLPLRLLVMISSPTGGPYATLDVAHEKQRLEQALAPLISAGKLTIDWMEKATLPELQAKLRTRQYHVFHFIGHGGFDDRAGEGVLILEDEQGHAWEAAPYRLGPLLHDHPSLRLAVLNSCEGARNSKTDAFAGTATSLIRQGIPAVVAMQFEITDGAALTFSGGFYSALAEGMPVDAAIAEARKAILVQANDIEWGTPVLYMRSPDGVLFDLAQSPAPPVVPAGQVAPVIAAEPAPPPIATTPPVEAPSPRTVAPEPKASEPAISFELWPVQPRAHGGAATFDLAVHNNREAQTVVRLQAVDEAGRATITLPSSVSVPGHGAETVRLSIKPPRRFFGARAKRAFTVSVSGTGDGSGNGPPSIRGEYEDDPMGFLPLAGGGAVLGLVAAGALFASGALSSGPSGPTPTPTPSPTSVGGALPPTPLPGGVLPPTPTPPLTGLPRLYFDSNRDTANGAWEEIYVMDSTGGNVKRLTDGSATRKSSRLPDVSPDGNRIVFVSERTGASELYLMNADGSDQRILPTTPGEKFEPNFSPDGRKIVFEVLQAPNFDIFVINVDGSGLTDLTPRTTTSNELDPFWSPDGKQIVFGSNRAEGLDTEIYVMDADGANPKRLTFSRGFDAEPAFSPDGKRIAFNSDRGGKNNIWVMNADGSGLQQVTNDSTQDFDPAWSRDGTQLAFTAIDSGSGDVLFVDMRGPLPVLGANLTSSPASDLKPVWGPKR